MQIKDLVNDFDITFVGEQILEMETECTHAKPHNEFFEGVLLTNENDNTYEMNMNLENDDEFARLALFNFDDEGFIIRETGYDDDGEILYVNEL